MFFVPDCDQFDRVKDFIESHGGQVVDQHDCISYQIMPHNVKLKSKHFYNGDVYSERWLKDFVEMHLKQNDPMLAGGNQLIKMKDENRTATITSNKAISHQISKKKKLTIVEGLKIFELISHKTEDYIKSQKNFWIDLERSYFLFPRTADQMKQFYKQNHQLTGEQWLVQAIHDNTEFSLSILEIPSSTFIDQFRERYKVDFQRLENNGDDDDYAHFDMYRD